MLGKILGGFLGPVSQQSQTTGEQEDVQSSKIGQQQQQDSAESMQGARSNAVERMSETGISGRMLATQLHSRLDSVKNEEKEKKPEAQGWAKTWGIVGAVEIVVVPEVVAVTHATTGTVAENMNPGADGEPAAKVKTESSDQKESLLPK